MIQAEIRKGEEELRVAQLVQMGSQGASTKWNLPERKLAWSDIWQMEPVRISFLLCRVYDVLPPLANLHRWILTKGSPITLCGKRGTLEHALSSCSTALSQGSYKWGQDRVLRQLANTLERERKKHKQVPQKETKIRFVRPAGSTGAQKSGVLQSSKDESRSEKRLVFPEVVQTILRPDILLCSPPGQENCAYRMDCILGREMWQVLRT